MERILNEKIISALAQLPTEPGVYIMRDPGGVVIYVGKARNLNNRVRQYFGSAARLLPKVAAMVRHVDEFSTIITASELEALILECNLIKQYQPYYNILLRDDKHFPYVRIDLKQDYPRIEIVRRVEDDGARYFGPFIAAHSIRDMLDTVGRLFPLRTCKKDIARAIERHERPCLNYQMGRCPGPCTGKVDKEEYAKAVKGVIDLLLGRHEKLERELTEKMLKASDELRFEEAAALRDSIALLKRVAQRQRAGFPNLTDKDVLAAAVGKDGALVQAFFVRGGKLSDARRFELSEGDDQKDVLDGFVKQYYADQTHIPGKIYTACVLPDAELISEWLTKAAGRKVELICPQRGDNLRLAELAHKNAVEALARKEDKRRRDYERTIGAAHALAEALGIDYPKRIECYDISNTQGTDSVASMVVFTEGAANKREYRRFRIKTVEGSNDFASMQEVLERRLLEGLRAESPSDTGFASMPDLIVVDGGKGQLSSAVDVLTSLGLDDLPIIGLAKKREEVFFPGESDPFVLPEKSPALKLLTSIRDEAHRFAITYHRSLREKRVIASELDDIRGVGEKRKKALLEAFGSVDGIKSASLDELCAVKGVDAATARRIYSELSEKKHEIKDVKEER